MVDKAIFTIDLADEQFKQFANTFEKFKAESAKIQSAWKANESLIEAATKNLKAMAAGKPAAQDHAESITNAMESWAGAGWGNNIGGGSKIFTANIRAATLHLAKWSGITTIMGALIGAGGIWGISRVAAGASAQRSTALRLGTTVGAQSAASAAFVGIPDSGKIISGLSEATSSMAGMGPLFQLMGRDAEGLRGGDPVESFVKILPRLKSMADQGGSWGSMQDRIKAMGLDKIGVSVETLRMLRALKPEDLKEMIETYRVNEPRMRMTDRDLKALQDFQTALITTEAELKNIFAAKLWRLTPIVEKMTALFTSTIEIAIKDGGIASELLEKFGAGMKDFGEWMGSPEFGKYVGDYRRDVEAFENLITTGLTPELKILLAAAAGYVVGGPWGAAAGAAAAVGSMWNGPDTEVGRARAASGVTPSFGTPYGGATPYNPDRADERRSSTPYQHQPKWGIISAPWRTPESGGTTPKGSGIPANFGEISHSFNAAAKHPEWGLHPGAIETTTVHGPDGQTWQVSKRAAAAFQSFIDEMHAKHPEYKLISAGGYNPRPKRGGGGWSMHAYGTAIDINAASNPFHGNRNTFPEDTEIIAARHGVSWGKHFGDPMHFEYTGIDPKFGGAPVSAKIDTGYGRRHVMHPQLQGQQNHVEVIDHSGEAAHVTVDSHQSGPLPFFARGSI